MNKKLSLIILAVSALSFQAFGMLTGPVSGKEADKKLQEIKERFNQKATKRDYVYIKSKKLGDMMNDLSLLQKFTQNDKYKERMHLQAEVSAVYIAVSKLEGLSKEFYTKKDISKERLGEMLDELGDLKDLRYDVNYKKRIGLMAKVSEAFLK